MPSAIFSDNLLHVSNVSFPECKAFINCISYANILHHFIFYFYDYKQLHKFKCNVSCCELKYCMHINVYKVNMHLLTRTNNQHSVKICKYLTCFIYNKYLILACI